MTTDPPQYVSDVTAAVVGTGFIGMAHVEALRRLGVRVRGVVGSSPERARPKAEPARLHVYGDLDDLLADDVVDVVHVASPNHLHAEQAHAVLRAGRHVVCEKPLGLDREETRGLLTAAEDARVVHAVCLNLRFYPLCHHVRSLVAAGGIGTPKLVSGHYLQDWLLRDTDWNWRLEPEKAGGLRAVADIGSHWLDLAQFMVGRPIEAVMADLHTLVPVRRHPEGSVESFAAAPADADLVEEEMSSDDAAGILLRFADGARGVVTVSQVSAGRKNSVAIEIDGADEAAAWCSEDPDRLWLGRRGAPNGILHRDPGMVSDEAARLITYPGGHVEGYPDTFRALFSQVYADVIAGGADARYPTFADGHDIVCVTDAVARSATEERWVTVER